MKIIPLSEGSFTIGFDKLFVPFNQATDDLQQRSHGSILVEVQPFLVITNTEVILMDTGLGFNNAATGKPQIYDNLAGQGYNPADVTMVLMSHLHKDHAGGVAFRNGDSFELAFPNARYFVYQREMEYAQRIGKPSYMPDELEPLNESCQVAWLTATEGEIAPGIQYWHTGAHCPEHIVFLLEEDGEKVFFGGDEAPQLKQMKTRYVAKYDTDGKKAMMLRQEYAERGSREGWQFLFYHDVKDPVAKLG